MTPQKKASHVQDSSLLSLPQQSVESACKDVREKMQKVVKLARADSVKTSREGGWTRRVEDITTHVVFDYVIATLILANALVIAAQTEIAARDPHGETPPSFRVFDLFFTSFFVVELAMRVFVEKKMFIFGRNKGWNCFDSFVVGSALLEEFLSASRSTTAVRVFRIMRLVRVIRVIRTLRVFKDLRAMVQGIISSILSLVWALVLLIVICFVIAVFITQIVTSYRSENAGGDYDANLDNVATNFGSLGSTMYSLYKSITGGDDWSRFADPLFRISLTMGIFFCLYIAFAVLAVLNVVTGVFVDNAIKANQRDTDTIVMEQTDDRQRHIEKVKSVFTKADTDGSGMLDLIEFQEHVDNPYVQAYFRHLDIDIEGVGAPAVFKLLDFDENGLIEHEEFVLGCGKIRGHAKSLELAKVAHRQHQIHDKLMSLATEQTERLDTLLSLMLPQLDRLPAS